MLKGNKGEWSELYVFLKLLADGKVYAADENLNRIDEIYFPINKIIREERAGELREYIVGNKIKILSNGEIIKEVSRNEINNQSLILLEEITRKKKGAFSIMETENFINTIFCYKLSAPSKDKTDITMEIVDVNTGYSPTVGFSIKSELGSAPTLLNAGKTTNFIYKIINNYPDMVSETNEIYRIVKGNNHTDVRGRMAKVIEDGGHFTYHMMENKTFNDNLVLIDSSLDKIIAHTLLYYYRDGISTCEDMVKQLEVENPLDYGNTNAYGYKIKKFLTAVALGMRPASVWDGLDEASGGYIIVTRDGNILAYHLYNRNYFEEYLLKNTKYETASTSRHAFGDLYEKNDEVFIKLNLQIRFK